jgi:hypothetical protein
MDEAGFISTYQEGIGPGDTFGDVVVFIISLINAAIPVLVALALVLFLWGAFRYVYKSADAHGKGADKEALLWGLIALFVLLSVWGILRILTNTFLGGSTGAPRSLNQPIDSRPNFQQVPDEETGNPFWR